MPTTKKTVETTNPSYQHYLVLTKTDLFEYDCINDKGELVLADYTEAVKQAGVFITIEDHDEAYIFQLVKVAKQSVIVEDYK